MRAYDRTEGEVPLLRRWLTVVLMATLCVAAACGDDDNDRGASSTEAPPTDFDPNAVLRYGTDFELAVGPTFDPARYNANTAKVITEHLYGVMIRRTADGIKPELATDWEFPDEYTIIV